MHAATACAAGSDGERSARAGADCCHPAKINYACLGNEVPHLPWHIVPRYPEDGWWGKAFSLRPAEQKRRQTAEEYARVRDTLHLAVGINR